MIQAGLFAKGRRSETARSTSYLSSPGWRGDCLPNQAQALSLVGKPCLAGGMRSSTFPKRSFKGRQHLTPQQVAARRIGDGCASELSFQSSLAALRSFVAATQHDVPETHTRLCGTQLAENCSRGLVTLLITVTVTTV
jgi:hypothetical protein